MAIKLTTYVTGVEPTLSRNSGVVDNKAAYTILVRFYCPVASPGYSVAMGVGRTTGTYNLNRDQDIIKLKSNGEILLQQISNSGTPSFSETGSGIYMTTGWYTLGIVRSSVTQAHMIIGVGTGTPVRYSASSFNVSDRTTSWLEKLLGDGENDNFNDNTVVTNHKCWNVALDDSQIAQEHLTTTVTNTTGFLNQAPMSDAGSKAPNLVITGTGSNWTAGTNTDYASNDPSVSYGGTTYVPMQSGVLTPQFFGFNPGFGR